MNQMTLPGHELSEADLIEIALRQPLQAKIDRAILMFQEYERAALRLSTDGYYLAFSGGKDSIVIKQLAIESGVKFAPWYNNTTIDPPELVWFIKRHHADVKWNSRGQHMLSKMLDKSNGPPTRLARWCCELYKEQGGNGCLKVIGVRIAESARRAKLWKEFLPNRNKGSILCPICYWTDEDVWAFIKSRNLPYCELYDQGFKRLGCIGCPMAGPAGQAKEFERWPKYEEMWKRAVFRFWDKWNGVPLEKPQRIEYDERTGPHPLAKETSKRLVDGRVVHEYLRYWRWFEDKGSAQGFWDWWRSGKASEGAAECFQQEMDLQR